LHTKKRFFSANLNIFASKRAGRKTDLSGFPAVLSCRSTGNSAAVRLGKPFASVRLLSKRAFRRSFGPEDRACISGDCGIAPFGKRFSKNALPFKYTVLPRIIARFYLFKLNNKRT